MTMLMRMMEMMMGAETRGMHRYWKLNLTGMMTYDILTLITRTITVVQNDAILI